MNFPLKVIRRQNIPLRSIQPHSSARKFEETGEDWRAFEKSIASEGVLVDLEVRELPSGGFQCIQGHRRLRAGVKRKLKTAWCLVLEATDAEALERLWLGNQHRADLTISDEIEGVQSLVSIGGLSLPEIARRWNRPLAWVQIRHQATTLGDEVLEAIARSGPDRLTMGAVAEILKVPIDLRGEAVQLVMHPVMGTLSEEEARDVLQRCLLEPQCLDQRWDRLKDKTTRQWRKKLRGQCFPGTTHSLNVVMRPLREVEAGALYFEDAEKLVGNDLPDAPDGLLWLHVAVFHEHPVQIVPGKKAGEHRAVVNTKILKDAEATARENGGHLWPKVRKPKPLVKASELRPPVELGDSRKKTITPWRWSADAPAETIAIPSIKLGWWGSQEIAIRPKEDGQCEWVGIEDVKAVQKDWLKGIRKEKDWPWIQAVANVSVRHWEGWEQGRPLPFSKAVWIHHRARSSRPNAD